MILDALFLFLHFLVLADRIFIGERQFNLSLALLLFSATKECLSCKVCQNEANER